MFAPISEPEKEVGERGSGTVDCVFVEVWEEDMKPLMKGKVHVRLVFKRTGIDLNPPLVRKCLAPTSAISLVGVADAAHGEFTFNPSAVRLFGGAETRHPSRA